MKHRRGGGDLRELIEGYQQKQRNIVWPDAMINATRANRLLWNGSPNPTRVQRVASWLIGSVLFAQGLESFGWAIRERASFGEVIIFVTLACAFMYAGTRIFGTGFVSECKGAASFLAKAGINLDRRVVAGQISFVAAPLGWG